MNHASDPITVTRLQHGPIIHPQLDPSIGINIQGPSLIKVPAWVPNPLGRYYLYFADHKGGYIRLAYANQLQGPWRIHVPGSLQLAQSHFLTEPPTVSAAQLAEIEQRTPPGLISHDILKEITTPHIASPDVHIDERSQRIVMYYHGLEDVGIQLTRVATSTDGIEFKAQPQILGRPYFRAFKHRDYTYALAMPGQLYRSRDGYTNFESGPKLFSKDMRHSAVRVVGEHLQVFWTQVGDAPETVLLSTVDLSGDWSSWQNSAASVLLRPEKPWEGANAPLEPSVRSTAYGLVNQLRDPAIYEEQNRVYLLYAIGGESGIAIAEVANLGTL